MSRRKKCQRGHHYYTRKLHRDDYLLIRAQLAQSPYVNTLNKKHQLTAKEWERVAVLRERLARRNARRGIPPGLCPAFATSDLRLATNVLATSVKPEATSARRRGRPPKEKPVDLFSPRPAAQSLPDSSPPAQSQVASQSAPVAEDSLPTSLFGLVF